MHTLLNTALFFLSFVAKILKCIYTYEGNPLAIKAVSPALGPGTVSTLILASLAATTNSYPGSLIKGNPASDTSATSRPNSNCSMIKAVCLSFVMFVI